MRAFLALWLLCVLPIAASAQSADQSLFVVHFATGPAWDESLPPNKQQGFAAHGANLGKLRKEGVIRFGARYGELGMIFLRAASLAEADALIAGDPGVRAGIFTYEVAQLKVFYPWRE